MTLTGFREGSRNVVDRYLVELTKTLKERERLLKHSLLRLRNLLFAYVLQLLPNGRVGGRGWLGFVNMNRVGI